MTDARRELQGIIFLRYYLSRFCDFWQQQQREQQEALEARLEEAKREAVARFWELLQDFVVVRAAPAAWLPVLSPSHPLLRVCSDLSGVRCVAMVRRPAP